MIQLFICAMLIASCTPMNQKPKANGNYEIENSLFRNDAIELARKYLENRNEMNNFHFEPIKVTEESLYFFVYFKRKINVRPQEIILKVNKKSRDIEKVDHL
jgi:hypothetical protein